MIQGCYKCGGKLHETGGTASNIEGMSQEQQMLMMIASTLKENISKLGQEDGVQSTLQFLAEKGLIDGSSEEGMQQGVSLIQAAVEHVGQAHGGRGISEEGLPEYTSGGYDDMKGGGEKKEKRIKKRMEKKYGAPLVNQSGLEGYDHSMTGDLRPRIQLKGEGFYKIPSDDENSSTISIRPYGYGRTDWIQSYP
jgi:hypothetical protein